MNKELIKVHKWLATSTLALNVDKPHFVLFHSSSSIPHRKIRIKIRNKRITEENDVKFLGVLPDSTLRWKRHITELSKKLSETIGILYKLRHYATADVLKFLYYALLYPFLIYGAQYEEWPTSPIWINYKLFRKKLLRPLVLVINMTAAILCFTPIVF